MPEIQAKNHNNWNFEKLKRLAEEIKKHTEQEAKEHPQQTNNELSVYLWIWHQKLIISTYS